VSDLAVPYRASFNFLTHCNMDCPFCYCPFDGTRSNLATWRRVVDRLNELGVKAITFGGGDPFIYDDFRELLTYVRNNLKGIGFVQVDTNGLRLREEDYELLSRTIDLLGLPLDGASELIHARMRARSGHFTSVLAGIRSARKAGVPVKINTVVSRMNQADIAGMIDLLRGEGIARWSLYEFWPLDQSRSATAEGHSIQHEEFLRTVEQVVSTCDFTIVEVGTIDSRAGAYFFVSDAGRAYALLGGGRTMYVELGSVFDADILVRWGPHALPRQVAARVLSRQLKL